MASSKWLEEVRKNARPAHYGLQDMQWFSDLYGNNLPLLQSDFSFYINTGKEDANEFIYLPCVTDVSIPNLGISFSPERVPIGSYIAQLHDASEISVTFWDTANRMYTNFFYNLYASNFPNNDPSIGLLKEEYKIGKCHLSIGSWKIFFYGVAWTSPRVTSISASSPSLCYCQTSFVFNDYAEQYGANNLGTTGAEVFRYKKPLSAKAKKVAEEKVEEVERKKQLDSALKKINIDLKAPEVLGDFNLPQNTIA